MAKREQFKVSTSGSSESVLHFWQNTLSQKNAPRGWVWLNHGASEHMGRYEEFAQFLNGWGLDVIGIDLLGHGETRVAASGNDKTVGDVGDMLKCIHQSMAFWMLEGKGKSLGHANTPYTLMGHSLGGLLALDWGSRNTQLDTELSTCVPGPKQIIAINPPLKLSYQIPKWKLGLAGILKNQCAHFEVSNDFEPETLTRDSAIACAARSDSLYRKKSNSRFYFSIMEAIERVNAVGNFEFPINLLLGDKDEIADYQGSVEFFKNLNSQKSQSIFKNYRHELLNDIGREEVFEACLKIILN